MSWLKLDHPCQWPSMFEISDKGAGCGSVWQCEICKKTWGLELGDSGHTWIDITNLELIKKLEGESQVETADQGPAASGEDSLVPKD